MASFLSHINQVPNLATDLQNIDMRREIQDQVALDKGVPHPYQHHFESNYLFGGQLSFSSVPMSAVYK